MSEKRRIIDSHSHLACKMLGHLDEGAGHMFRIIPQADVPIPEVKLWGGIDYYEEYTRAGFPGERMWPKEIWERGENDPEFKKAMTAADTKWMGNRCPYFRRNHKKSANFIQKNKR